MASELSTRSVEVVVAESTILILINVISLVGNALVALTIYKSPRLRKTSDLYIFALAVTDLLWASCVMPMTATTLITGKWIFSDAVCEFQASIDYFVLYSSPVTMGLAAFNRYIKIVRPTHYKIIFSFKRSRMLLMVSWLFLVLYIVIVRTTKWQMFEFISTYALCVPVYSSEQNALIHYCITISIFFLFPFTVFVFSYFHVYKVIRRHNRRVGVIFHNRATHTRVTVQEINISRSLFFLIAVFAVCWLPTWAIALPKRLQPTVRLHRSLQLLPVFLPFLSSAINPFVYTGNNPLFKSEFRRLFCPSREHNSSIRLKVLRAKVNPVHSGDRPCEIHWVHPNYWVCCSVSSIPWHRLIMLCKVIQTFGFWNKTKGHHLAETKATRLLCKHKIGKQGLTVP